MSRRLSTRDASWLGVASGKVVGPLAGITVDGVRRALIDLHAHRPESRVVCRLDAAARRWRPMSRREFAAWAHRLVLDVGVDDADAVTAQLLREPLGERPVLFAAGGPYAGIAMSHATGDARLGDALFAEILAAATGGRTAWHPYPRPARLPLARAIGHQLVTKPGRLPRALRVARAPRATGGAGAWTPAVAHHAARSAPGMIAELRRWRDAHAPGISVGSVLFSVVHAAVERVLGPPDPPGLVVLVDARRYLPAGAAVEGNFAWGEHLRPRDPNDPRAVHAEMRDLLGSRRALTLLALHNARAAVRRDAAVEPQGRATDPRPHLTVTYLGRADAYAPLDWADPEKRRLVDVVTPGGPQAVTVALEELGGALHVTTTYHANVFDPAAVAAVTEAVAGDPVELLSM
ncbi:hypothetical protein [Spirilliplanes yamanashiensis]|uniref:Uncharacterized protein n=1 Tax=Spirilliplanes yamanashiensis TaxID=42233 RepID=A0A8J4DK24_9ACTN|nr:hypothetical protein [Spirilliplanes yamanashiensis]MDP9817641.1 hypothetical protein [Spirilliplanes yamanashiensis]GIJ04451.1 hypothetical protein Sya03_38030 [Spirilliplanes yamanashiensis]